MKKLLFVLTLGLSLSACSLNASNTNIPAPVIGTGKTFTVGETIYPIFKGTDNHEYYRIRTNYYWNYLHYPACELCNKKL